VAETLRLMAHPLRLRILEVLRERRQAPVGEVADAIGLAAAASSQHLNRMRREGLLAAERRGREVWYRVADRRALKLLRCICSEVPCRDAQGGER